MLHIHLDPLGGVAGDMFAAALLDAFPEHAAAVAAAAGTVSGAECRLVAHDDHVLTGSRFIVRERSPDHADAHNHGVDAGAAAHDHGGRAAGHAHVAWAQIRSRIAGADLPEAVRRHALGIFTCLAEAEASVHGCAPDSVTFHEVGAADSVADIVAAAALIAAVGPASWSTAPLPAGSGRVHTAHGVLPVPAPATALLLQGFALTDDGIEGERVTPTGAAILRYLAPETRRRPGILRRCGVGLGTRTLPGISNCLRVLVLETAEEVAAPPHRELAMIGFEVDDQSGEDLAAGIDRIRAADGVHDVIQMAAIGKKGRMAVHVQVLARPDRLEAVVEMCFAQTTTIGLRTQKVQGRALPRRFAEAGEPGRSLRVKLVERPGGMTAKAEADHLLHLDTHAARVRRRRQAEAQIEAGSGAPRIAPRIVP